MLRRAQTSPANPTGKTEPVQPFRIVIGHTRWKHRRFPRSQWQLATVELFQDGLQPFQTFDPMFLVDSLPGEKKTIEIVNRDGLNFRPQSIDRESMNSRQQSAITPFLLGGMGMKFAAQHKTFRFECEQCCVNFRLLQNQRICELADHNWSTNLHPTANQFANRIDAVPSFSMHRIGQNHFRLTDSVRIDRPKHRKPLRRDTKTFSRGIVLDCADMSAL